MLEYKPLPSVLQQLWTLFIDLNAYRQVGMSSNPLALADIEAYCRFHDVILTPWELGTLKAIDVAVMSIWNKPKPQSEKMQ